MVSLDEKINEVLELDQKATKAPWFYQGYEVFGKHAPIIARAEYNKKGFDAFLITQYRSLCPELAKKLKLAKEALSQIAKYEGCSKCYEKARAEVALEELERE